MRRFSPRKALGQSFLTHGATARLLVDALYPEPVDTVVEIGPGRGALTRLLLGRVDRVVAVEIDRRLAAFLSGELGLHRGFQLVNADFLLWKPDFDQAIKVIGNLPYSASSPMLFRLLDDLTSWTVAVLTTQREFARRVLGSPGSKDYGALSVFCERLCRRERLLTIPGQFFRPRPDVVSVAFRLVRRERPSFVVEDELLFRRVVKTSFAHRRKMIANNLAAGFGISRSAVEKLLGRVAVDPRSRAEAIPARVFGLIAAELTAAL